jgi:hypothetical protein
MPKFVAEGALMGNVFCPALNARNRENGQSSSFAHQMLVGRRCRAAQTSTAPLFSCRIEIE